MKKNNSSISMVIIAIIFILFFIFVGYICLSNLLRQVWFVINGTETVATVSFVEETYIKTSDAEDECDEVLAYKVFIEYTVDGKDYVGKLPTSSAHMQKEDKVAIYYNPKSPGDFSTKSVFWMIANLLGICIIAIGCTALWKVLNFMGYMPDVKKKKNLEEK